MSPVRTSPWARLSIVGRGVPMPGVVGLGLEGDTGTADRTGSCDSNNGSKWTVPVKYHRSLGRSCEPFVDHYCQRWLLGPDGVFFTSLGFVCNFLTQMIYLILCPAPHARIAMRAQALQQRDMRI